MEMLLNVKVLHLLHDFLLWVERTGMNYTFLDVKLSNIFIMTLRNSTLEPESVNVENFRRHLRDFTNNICLGTKFMFISSFQIGILVYSNLYTGRLSTFIFYAFVCEIW